MYVMLLITEVISVCIHDIHQITKEIVQVNLFCVVLDLVVYEGCPFPGTSVKGEDLRSSPIQGVESTLSPPCIHCLLALNPGGD